MNGALRSLLGAARLLQRDPVGLLLPAGGALLLDAAPAFVLPHLWPETTAEIEAAALRLGGVWLLALPARALLRSRVLAVGARAAGLEAAPWGRPGVLLALQIVISAAAAAAALLIGLPVAGLAAIAASLGLIATGAVLFALGLVFGLCAALTARAALALAPSLAVVGGRSARQACVESMTRCPQEIRARLLIVLAGDVLISAGGLLCGAGGLPGYPITDLALLLSWQGDRRSAA